MPFVPRPIKERLLSTKVVDIQTGCWNWIGSSRGIGYGRLKHQSKTWAAHRLSYTVFVGPITEGLWVCHRCDNPSCINPDHLFLGTPLDNNQDMVCKNRNKSCPGVLNGTATLNEEQVLEIARLAKTGEYKYKDIGDLYGVSATCVGQINRKESWKYLNR